jgi:hypothetical protein
MTSTGRANRPETRDGWRQRRTSQTSAARRAATRVRMKWLVGISTLPAAAASQPVVPHASIKVCATQADRWQQGQLHVDSCDLAASAVQADSWPQGRKRTAEVAALLLGGQLVLKVHASGACLDHGLQVHRECVNSGRPSITTYRAEHSADAV